MICIRFLVRSIFINSSLCCAPFSCSVCMSMVVALSFPHTLVELFPTDLCVAFGACWRISTACHRPLILCLCTSAGGCPMTPEHCVLLPCWRWWSLDPCSGRWGSSSPPPLPTSCCQVRLRMLKVVLRSEVPHSRPFFYPVMIPNSPKGAYPSSTNAGPCIKDCCCSVGPSTAFENVDIPTGYTVRGDIRISRIG